MYERRHRKLLGTGFRLDAGRLALFANVVLAAIVATQRGLDGDGNGATEDGVFEGDVRDGFDVLASRRASRATPTEATTER